MGVRPAEVARRTLEAFIFLGGGSLVGLKLRECCLSRWRIVRVG